MESPDREEPAAMDRIATILLVEDEPLLRRLVTQFLRSATYEVVGAEDGPSAVAQFAERGPFELVLLDLNLPGLSGVEVCRRIHALCPDQRVLVCSAAILPEAETILRSLGVDTFLTKPYQPEELLTAIAREVSLSMASV
jgi:CheY-like chemotaxis protein